MDYKEKILLKIEKHKQCIEKNKEKIKFHENKISILKKMLDNNDYQKSLLDKRWKEKRKQILELKGNVCSKCGSTDNLHVHHLYYKPKTNPWDYPDDALVILCKKCHNKIHDII